MNTKSLLMHLKNKNLALLLCAVVSLTACKKWDNHIEVTNQDLNQNLLEAISSNSDLSTFRQYISKTGLDSLLQASKTFTVWAPTNSALQNLDPAIVNDPSKLKSFVLNHIANESRPIRDVQGTTRVPMLNGKYLNFSSSKFDDATIKTNKFVKNGMLYTIDKGIVVLPNIWEFINSSTTQYAQNRFVANLNFNDFDPSLAIVDSISANTGLPVYRPGTGIVVKNKFKEKVYDLSREDKQYTYFVVTDANFIVESDSLKKYYATTSTTTTDTLSKWNTVKDFAVEGVYASNQLSGLVSKYGVPIPVNPANIIETQKMSNGIVYILSNLDVKTNDKFKTIYVQGESPNGFLSNKSGNTFYRLRTNPITGQQFWDLLISGHGTTGYYSYYDLPETPSITYQVYGLAQVDFQTSGITQKIVAKDVTVPSLPVTLTTLTHNVPLATNNGAVNASAYNEILLGNIVMTNYGTLEIQLTANNSTTPMVLDYLRLVPQP
jgi:uncharacterized surface protein with fasciclin (FAS1) repeats